MTESEYRRAAPTVALLSANVRRLAGQSRQLPRAATDTISMILTNLVSRGFLLIAIAASAGMVAQEMVSRASTADEPRADASRPAQEAWRSAEAFYQSSSLARQMFAQVQPKPLTTQLADAEAVAEPQPGATTAFDPTKPATIPSQRPMAIVAQSPHPGYTESWNANGYSQSEAESPYSSTTDPGACTESSSATAIAASTSPVELGDEETVSIALADERPPIGDREAAPPDETELDHADMLPPPALRKAQPDTIKADALLPPWQDAFASGPFDNDAPPADGAMGEPAARNSFPHDARYIDPGQLVRERAIERGQQRQQRLDARRRLGYSPLRPPVQASPFTSGDQLRPIVVLMPAIVVIQEETSASER